MTRALGFVAKFLLASVAVVSAIAWGQQQGGFMNNFTGDIEIVDSSEMRSSRIRFEAGARTNWHVHSEPQLLLIEEGTGRWQEQGGAVQVLNAGEPVLTRGAVSHWHGAAPDQAATQFSVYAGTLEWQQAVTDDEYLGR